MTTNRIWKYELEIKGQQTLRMPEGATILSAAAQHWKLCLWVLVDPTKRNRLRYIELFDTDERIKEAERAYIGSVVMEPFVWHVFERLQGFGNAPL